MHLIMTLSEYFLVVTVPSFLFPARNSYWLGPRLEKFPMGGLYSANVHSWWLQDLVTPNLQ